MKVDALERVVATMRDFPARWGIAGGWVLSLCSGRVMRAHADVDVAILRADQQHVWTSLRPAQATIVDHGHLRTWTARETIAPPIHEAHMSWPDGRRLELLLNEYDPATDHWVYRRDSRVRRSVAQAFIELQGIPCLAPEIVLLYKSKAPRPHDTADFVAALPALTQAQRTWLHGALELASAGHPWAATLVRGA